LQIDQTAAGRSQPEDQFNDWASGQLLGGSQTIAESSSDRQGDLVIFLKVVFASIFLVGQRVSGWCCWRGGKDIGSATEVNACWSFFFLFPFIGVFTVFLRFRSVARWADT